MKIAVIKTLETTLLRILEADPEISLSNAKERVIELFREGSSSIFDENEIQNIIENIGNDYVRQGIINPTWLASKGFHPHFFLIKAQPDWLETLTEQVSDEKLGISQYTIYGSWDSLLILRGTSEEAEQRLQEISRVVHSDDITYFSAIEIPYIYRYRSKPLDLLDDAVNESTINKIVLEYDDESATGERESLQEKGLFLGPVWNSKSFSKERIVAFTGISIRGREDVSSAAMLDLFLSKDVLKKTLVHLYKADIARPFDFLAKLACENMEELDKAIDAVTLSRLGPIRLESNTMVVSKGIDQPPLYRASSIPKVNLRPQMEDLELMAKDLVAPFGEEAIENFNFFEPRRKLSILAGLNDFQHQLGEATWDPDWTERIGSSVESFARSVLRNSDQIHLTGAVTEVTSAVEGAIKRALRVLAEKVYGKDYAQAQTNLKLPTKDFRRLSLGKCTNALKQMKTIESFSPFVINLTDEWIEKLEWFTEERNVWAHDAIKESDEIKVIDRARRAIVEGMAIARWIHTELLSASEEAATEEATETKTENFSLPDKPKDRSAGFFISYSSRDKKMADRIATSLKAIGYKVWYDSWAIEHGDSIVSKIENGLAQNDTLLVLLSPNSVTSEWVKRELSAILMRQLDGHNVKILPVMIEDCEVPTTLIDIKYIDFRRDFQDGIITLMKVLAERKKLIQ
ncbi:MAG: toll/interleukin-1 receptor domain-containing protein [Phormidesmis sp.]